MVKQLDYLKLVKTARRSSYYARPSARDDSLKNLVLVLAVMVVVATVLLAVALSYFGFAVQLDDVGRPIGITFLLSIAYFVVFLFLGGAPILGRYLLIAVSALGVVGIAVLAGPHRLDSWYLFVPLFLYTGIVGVVSFRQIVSIEVAKTEEGDA